MEIVKQIAALVSCLHPLPLLCIFDVSAVQSSQLRSLYSPLSDVILLFYPYLAFFVISLCFFCFFLLPFIYDHHTPLRSRRCPIPSRARSACLSSTASSRCSVQSSQVLTVYPYPNPYHYPYPLPCRLPLTLSLTPNPNPSPNPSPYLNPNLIPNPNPYPHPIPIPS